MDKKTDFLNRIKTATPPKAGEDENFITLDENRTLLWQYVGFCDSDDYGFNNIMASIVLDKKAKKVRCNYRFMYEDGRKNWYHFRDKDNSLWIDYKPKFVEDTKATLREAFAHLEKLNGSKITVRELEYTGKETPEELMEIMRKSELMNMARTDKKTGETEIIDEDKFDKLNL